MELETRQLRLRRVSGTVGIQSLAGPHGVGGSFILRVRPSRSIHQRLLLGAMSVYPPDPSG